MKTPDEILDAAYDEHKPSTVIACFSGGYDSMTSTHIGLQWAKRRDVKLLTIAVDTRIAADGWRKFVTSAAAQLGAGDFQIWMNPDIETWENDVKAHGFIYDRSQHKFYFYYLKQRAFRQLVQANKRSYKDRVMFVNGVRRAESDLRANTPEYERIGAGVYVNPIVYWSNEEVATYRADHDFPINPFYERTGNSGDCLCNWHRHITPDQLHTYAKDAANVIDPLDAYSREHFGYGYGEMPTKGMKAEAAGQLRLFEWDTECTPNLCAGCNKPEPRNEVLDFVSFQRMDW